LEAPPGGPADQRARKRWPLAVLMTGAVGIGLAPIFVRWSEVGPAATAFWRLALALPFFWLWLGMERGKRGHGPQDGAPGGHVAMLVLPGVFFAADLGIWHWSIRFTTVANATLFANCAPIVVAAFAWVWLGERLTGLFVVGLACALSGAASLVAASFTAGPRNVLGDALGLLTAFTYGAYILAAKKARARFSTPLVMAWCIPVACGLLIVAALAGGERILAPTGRAWAVLAALAVFCQVGGQGLIVHALAHLPASFSSVALLVQPVATALFGWALLGERIGPYQGAAGGLVLLGICLARLGSRAK